MVITKPRIGGSYTEYYISTRSPKLKKLVDIKEIILQEAAEKLAYMTSKRRRAKSC